MAKARFLNNDVFFDVLSRLPAKVLAGLKRVSRGWHSLISDRPFVHVQLRRMKPEVSGFIFQQKFQWSDEDFKTVLYIPIEKGNFRVQQTVFDFLPDDVVVLASCKGLVCCRSCFPTRDPAIYICNPLNKEWVTLRWAELDQDSCIAFAFDPHQDPIDTSTNFKLVRVQQFESDEEEAKKYFARCKNCTQAYLRRRQEGWDLSRLTIQPRQFSYKSANDERKVSA